MSKEIEDIMKEVDKIMSDENKLNDFKDSFTEHCYSNMINQDEREIYEESLLLFSKEQCVGTVLSILVMQYPVFGINTKEKILKEHSKLYYPFVVDECMLWTIDKILNLYNKEKCEFKKDIKLA